MPVNPFTQITRYIGNSARDLQPLDGLKSDTVDLETFPVALRIATAGTIRVTTIAGQVRNITVADNSELFLGIRRLHSTGTTATGIEGYIH